MKRGFDEEMLSAYMDGELDSAATQMMEEIIDEDESARACIIDAVKAGARLRSTLNPTLDERIPERLLDAAQAVKKNRLHLKPVLSGIIRLAAAVVILLGGFAAGRVLQPGDDKHLPNLTAALPAPYLQVVNEALEHNLSGTPRQWQPAQNSVTVTVTPVRTYRHRDGRYFREFKLEVSGGPQPVRVNGLAYRAEKGRWATKAIFF